LKTNFPDDYQKRQSLQQELTARFGNKSLNSWFNEQKMKTQAAKSWRFCAGWIRRSKKPRWPMTKIIDLIPERNGFIHIARVKTQQCILLRPLERLYPLEMSSPLEARIIKEKIEQPAVSLVERRC
jgi:hypothetical protein